MIKSGKRYLTDESEAKDALQASFISIFDKIGKFEYRGAGSLMAWMQRITANCCISMLRRRKRLTFTPLTEDIVDDSYTEGPDYDTLSQTDIFEAIRSLPDGYRTVLNLYVFEDLSHREIAKQLGITEGTSASQLHRAKAMLWKKLKKDTQ